MHTYSLQDLLSQLMGTYDRRETSIRNEWDSVSKKWSILQAQGDLSLEYAIGHPDIARAVRVLKSPRIYA